MILFEPVEGNPETVVQECHRLLRPGVMARVPGDFWRFTRNGVRMEGFHMTHGIRFIVSPPGMIHYGRSAFGSWP